MGETCTELAEAVQKLTGRVDDLTSQLNDTTQAFKKEAVGLALAFTALKADIGAVVGEAAIAQFEAKAASVSVGIWKKEFVLYDMIKEARDQAREIREQAALSAAGRLPHQLDGKITAARNAARGARQKADDADKRARKARTEATAAKGRADANRRRLIELQPKMVALQTETRRALVCCNTLRGAVRRAQTRADQAWTRSGQARAAANAAQGRADRAMRDVRALQGEARSASTAIQNLRADITRLDNALR